MDAWFKRNFGQRAQTEHDRFVTDLANAQSSAGTRLGTDFCPHNGVIFREAMALHASDDLALVRRGPEPGAALAEPVRGAGGGDAEEAGAAGSEPAAVGAGLGPSGCLVPLCGKPCSGLMPVRREE